MAPTRLEWPVLRITLETLCFVSMLDGLVRAPGKCTNAGRRKQAGELGKVSVSGRRKDLLHPNNGLEALEDE